MEQRAVQNQIEAFDLWLDRTLEFGHKYAAYLGEPPEAVDIVQEAFLRCGRASDDYRREALLLSGWLAKSPSAQGRRIAPNEGYWMTAIRRTRVDWFRRRSVRSTGDLRASASRSAATPPPTDYEDLKDAWHSIAPHLSQGERDVILLRFRVDLTLESCAGELGITRRQFEGLLSRTLAKCYRILWGDEPSPPGGAR